jgi:hypothetical protein
MYSMDRKPENRNRRCTRSLSFLPCFFFCVTALAACGTGGPSAPGDAEAPEPGPGEPEIDGWTDPDSPPEADTLQETPPDPLPDNDAGEVPADIPPITSVSLGVTARTQDMISDNEGTFHLIWVEGGALRYGQILDESIVNRETAVASGITILRTRPRIAVRPDAASIHACWVGPDAAAAEQVYHTWKEAGGAWRTETALQQAGYYYAQPSLAVELDGTLHLVTQRWNDAGEPVFYSRKPAGGTWSTPVRLSSGNGRDIAMFSDSQGGVHAVYNDASRRYYRFASAGQILSDAPAMEVPRLDDNVRGNYFGDLYVDDDGAVYAAFATWCADETATIDLSSKTPAGEFSIPTRPSAGPINSNQDSWPAVGTGRDAAVYVLWGEHHPDGSSACMLSILSGGIWIVSTLDDDAALDGQTKPSVAVTDDAVLAVWRHAGGELFLARLDPGR